MKVLSFGEVLLRLAAPGYTRFFQKDSLETSFCGGEANVAVSLALLGIDSVLLTKLPNNDIGIAATNAMRYFGVDINRIIYGDGRMGLYYLEKGASQRSSKVIYDRKFSAIALAKKEEFDWELLFKDIEWFHFSGINPALSDNLVSICLDACKEAKRRGITISCDLNYRSNLWNSETAMRVMKQIMPYVDVCIANEEDAEKVLGIKPENNNIETGDLNKEGYYYVAQEICNRYGCTYVAITMRESYSASNNGWSALLYNAEINEAFYSKKYNIQIVDRVGSGDSFSAGLIYGLVMGNKAQDVIEFATAASCLKHTIEGDFNRVSREEIEKLMKSGGNGRVQR